MLGLRCPAVSVRRVRVEMGKHILKLFSPYGRHIILVFAYQMFWTRSDA